MNGDNKDHRKKVQLFYNLFIVRFLQHNKMAAYGEEYTSELTKAYINLLHLQVIVGIGKELREKNEQNDHDLGCLAHCTRLGWRVAGRWR